MNILIKGDESNFKIINGSRRFEALMGMQSSVTVTDVDTLQTLQVEAQNGKYFVYSDADKLGELLLPQTQSPSTPKMLRTEPSASALAELERMHKEREEYQRALPAIRKDGEAALRRLLEIAQGHSGQCRHVAAFLLGLYNGMRFPFDLTDFRSLDRAIFEDCLTVLRMDYTPAREVHTYFDNGGDEGHKIWEGLALAWNIKDRLADEF
ncbi:MAG: hypothetical protein PHF20_01480 [Halothiobacillaceae bacterium]|nr:hypothetical protein [Halothiobacillaceae bacterium]